MTYTYDRTASAKFDIYANLMVVHRKADEIQNKGVQAVLAKINSAAKPFKYALDMKMSEIGFQVHGSDPDAPVGELLFVPLPSRDMWASEDEMGNFLVQTFDLYGVRGVGDGKFRVDLG